MPRSSRKRLSDPDQRSASCFGGCRRAEVDGGGSSSTREPDVQSLDDNVQTSRVDGGIGPARAVDHLAKRRRRAVDPAPDVGDEADTRGFANDGQESSQGSVYRGNKDLLTITDGCCSVDPGRERIVHGSALLSESVLRTQVVRAERGREDSAGDANRALSGG